MMARMMERRHFLLGVSALALAGCGDIVGPGKALQLYVLAPAMPAGNGAPVNWQLSVALPGAPAALDTVRVALNPTPLTLDYFANAQWPDRLPLMLQGLLLEGFEKDGRAPGAARDTSGIHADYVLESEIREFQARYNTPPDDKGSQAAPQIHLRLGASLMAMPQNNVVARKEWSKSVAARSNALPDIIIAFNSATAELLADIIAWTIATAPPLAPQQRENDALMLDESLQKPRKPARRTRP